MSCSSFIAARRARRRASSCAAWRSALRSRAARAIDRIADGTTATRMRARSRDRSPRLETRITPIQHSAHSMHNHALPDTGPTHDRRALYATAFLRAVATAQMGVLLGLYLAARHLDLPTIGF